MESEAEFMVALSIYGGILFAGVTVSLVLIGIILVLRKTLSNQKLIKKMYEQKERKNGKG